MDEPKVPDPNPAETAPAPAPETATTPAPDAPGLLERMFRVIDRALASNPKRSGWQQTCWMILDSQGGQEQIVGPKVLGKLRELQARYDRAIEVINSHTRLKAKDAWLAHQTNLADAIGGGTVTQHQGRTREDFESDFDLKVRAAHEEMRRVYRESLPWCREIFDRFSEIATSRVEYLEAGERERHEDYGVPYAGPSALIVAFKKAIETAGFRVKETSGGNLSPLDLIPYLDF
jgi:hypothetical protein